LDDVYWGLRRVMRRTFEAVTCDFAVSFVRGVERRRFVLLGEQCLRPGDVVAVFCGVIKGVSCSREFGKGAMFGIVVFG
jgi:hypothetical protein